MTLLKLGAIRVLLPAAVRWVEGREREVLEEGKALDGVMMENARKVGVEFPERIRVLSVESVWGDENGMMMRVARLLGFCDPRTQGLCCRYGVLVLRGIRGYDETVLHECVHTGQYERLGGVRAFLVAYLRECVVDGYPDGELEREAIERSEA